MITSFQKKSAYFMVIMLFLLLIGTRLLAVSEAAVLSLMISPSSEANAMGQTYGNITSTSPMATIFNPASLGFFAQKNYFGTSFYPEKVAWLPSFASDISLDTKVNCIGINLDKFLNIPLSVGIARYNTHFDLGEQVHTDEVGTDLGSFNSWEKYVGTTFSVALDYYIRASFGYTSKSYESNLSPVSVGAVTNVSAEGRAFDIGMLFELPIINIVQKMRLIDMNLGTRLVPFLNAGYYYSKTNVGDKVVYLDAAQADPLPRNLSLGVNLSAGLVYEGKLSDITLFHYKWAREVNDMLIKRYADGTTKYQSGLNDIKLWENVFAGKSNDKIIAKKGYELNLGDIYYYRKGKYEDSEGYVFMDTEGWAISYTRPLLIVCEFLNIEANNLIMFVSKINIEKHYARYITNIGHPLSDTEFKSYVIRLQNFPLDALFK